MTGRQPEKETEMTDFLDAMDAALDLRPDQNLLRQIEDGSRLALAAVPEHARQSIALVREIWSDLQTIVIARSMSSRVGRLSEAQAKRVDAGQAIDLRLPALMSLSAKGSSRFLDFYNVTALDHFSSVSRGALMLAEMDLRQDLSVEERRPLLALDAAFGFGHDANKPYGVEGKDLTADQAAEFFATTGLSDFLKKYGFSFTGAQILALIQSVESGQGHSLAAFAPVDPRHRDAVRRYVRMADQLDSASLKFKPDVGGRVLRKLQALAPNLMRRPEHVADQKIVSLDMPHLSFLLDLVQREMGAACRALTGFDPLIEISTGTRLTLLLPGGAADAITERAVENVVADIPFDTEILVDPLGTPKIGGATPVPARFLETIRAAAAGPKGNLAAAAAVKVVDLEKRLEDMRALFSEVGLPFSPPKKANKNASVLSVPASQDPAFETAVEFLAIAAALGLAVSDPRSGAPATRDRIAALEEAVSGALGPAPDWFASLDPLSLRTLAAARAVSALRQDKDQHLRDRILGRGGLVEGWVTACVKGRDDRSLRIREQVAARLRTMLAGDPIILPDDGTMIGCAITGEPVEASQAIGPEDGLYGLKSSAITFRSGRPENRTSDKGHTVVGPLAYADLRLRTRAFSRSKGGGLPILVASPGERGLFGGMVRGMGQLELGLYDILRADVSKGTTYLGWESSVRPVRLARYEEYPSRLADRLDFVRMALEATLRFGRPMHLFRGLAQARPEFFYADFLDPEIAQVLGGRSLRLDQIPAALKRLQLASLIAGTSGLGMTVFKKYASSHPFEGAVLAWTAFEGSDGQGHASAAAGLHQQLIEMEKIMTPAEPVSAVVRLGRLAASIQSPVTGKSSNNEKSLVFRVAVEGAKAAWLAGMKDRDGLIAAISGRLVEDLRRSDLVSAASRRNGATLEEAAGDFAALFVDEVWHGPFKGRPPANETLRTMNAAFWWSFLTSSRETRAAEKAASTPSAA